MRRRHFGLPGLLAVGVVATVAAVPYHATAAWPPGASADMTDSANWPNDPSYGYSSSSDGQWNYYSFMPTEATKVRSEEKASGMSIDLAWRITIGDPSIRIAVTDSGIEWDKDDLLEKAWINYNELVNHKPLDASGNPCGGQGELAGFDCNGDGVLTVSDYKDMPSLQPDAQGGNPKGDKNQNGRLDAGDLILNFSDGIDDDQNGYIDDISGWDFFKNDNDPYDDTRYGHGTGEAEDSTAQANNGMGEAGVCPLCRFIPMRVGDSFITDVHEFGKAVVYATDNGAKVVQCALGTINMNRFAQAALDYAYKKDVLVITSMADENSRHHNMPAAANHTLPVHAIQYDGSGLSDSTTFVDYHPCSNYGGQNFLSASGTSCSSEAVGRLSGIAGLLYSAALKYNVMLSPGEAQNLLFMNADDIDVSESQTVESQYEWSQPGFDQRFGYGRANANRALEAIRDGKIPPSVDITSPKWFQVLYKDQVEAAIDIEGAISAKRANSYDYFVEWAPGVQPFDSAFQIIAQQQNVPPTTVIGESAPIASMDIRTFDVTHDRDVDSPHGENDTAITVRIRAVAHYGGTVGDVPGEMRRTYYVHQDPTLLKGFPIYVGDSGEGSPKMVDLDGDGIRELLYPTAGGELHALKMTASGSQSLPGFPFKTNIVDGFVEPSPTPTTPVYLNAPGYATDSVDINLAHEAILNAPAIADLDSDQKPEIVISTYPGTIYVIGNDGQIKSGWPIRLPEVPSCPLDPTAPQVSPCMSKDTRIARGAFASPVLVDLNGDNKLDIVQAAFDGKIYVYDASGTPLDGWPVDVHYTKNLSPEPATNRILTTPAVGDFNDDGVPDLLVGSNEQLGNGGQAGAAYLIDGRGNAAPGGSVLPNWPVSMTSLQLFPLVAEGVANSPVIGRFEGKLAAVVHGNATLPLVLPADPGTQSLLTDTPTNALPPATGEKDRGIALSSIFGPATKASTPNTMLPLFAQPSLGDIDQDGTPDVIASGGSLGLALSIQSASESSLGADHLLSIWSGKTGYMMPGSPYILEDFTFFNSQAVVDLSGDNYPEVVTGSGGYFLHAFDACGREPKDFPKFTGQWIISTAAVGDIDGDGKLDVAVGTRSGWLYAWRTDASTDTIVEWESFHHDNRNTGNLETPLEQGGQKKAQTPLTLEMCLEAAAPAPAMRASGGCECNLAMTADSSSDTPVKNLGWLGVMALVWLRRRRPAIPHEPRKT